MFSLGYGKSNGEPTENGCYEDIDAAYLHLTTVLNKQPGNIVIYGRSVGSGPSCYLAERLSNEGIQLGGLIIQSPIMSVFRVAFNFRFTFIGDMFPNIDRFVLKCFFLKKPDNIIDRIGNINCPILVIHGTRDEIVPFWNGESLFLAANIKYRAKPIWVNNAGHNNIEYLLSDEIFYDLLKEYFKEWIPIYCDNNELENSTDLIDFRSSRTPYTGHSIKMR